MLFSSCKLTTISNFFHRLFTIFLVNRPRKCAGKSLRATRLMLVVPTGNFFGNTFASYYASIMGLPINKFICASNSNNVLLTSLRQVFMTKQTFLYNNFTFTDILEEPL